MTATAIEWTDEVWNLITGCDKVSQGCKNCYAERVAARFWGKRKFTDVQVHYDRMEIPLSWRKPRKVFVNSMSDLFHEDVSFDVIDQAFAVMALTPEHTYQILTKRPQRMLEYMQNAFGTNPTVRCIELVRDDDAIRDGSSDEFVARWPLRNVQLGVSVEDQDTANERIPILLQVPAAVLFLSIEPMLGPVILTRLQVPGVTWFDCLEGREHCHPSVTSGHRHIDWVICGGESGHDARPMHPDWPRRIRDDCVAAGVAFFFKQWGEWAPIGTVGSHAKVPYNHDFGMVRVGKKLAGRLLDGREWNEYPKVTA